MCWVCDEGNLPNLNAASLAHVTPRMALAERVVMLKQAAYAHKLWRRWMKQEAGNVAIIFALAIVPIMGGVGASVDVSRAYVVKSRLNQALDAAGLAVGSLVGYSDAELTAKAQAFFEANYPASKLGVTADITIQQLDGVVVIEGTAKVQTVMVSFIGVPEIDVSASVEITRESKGLEVVLVLDNTGSMSSNGKLSAMKEAATEMVEILFGDETTPEKLKVGLVPFAAGVNLGPDFLDSGYMDTAGISSTYAENFKSNTNVWNLYKKLQNRSWEGCVETRPYPYDETDAIPTSSNGDTLWVPWFAPDEPDTGGTYYNNYLDDKVKSGSNPSVDKRQRKTGKYKNQYVSSSSKGPSYGCNIPAVTALTNHRGTIEDGIDDLVASGYTHIPIGLAWGWRLLSPQAPFTEGVAYDDEEYTKAIILLTDGQNVLGTMNNHNGKRYTAYGFLPEERLGTSSGWQAQQELDYKTARLCENVKAEGIRVYTITFQLNDTTTQNLMRACATNESLYFNSPSNEQLRLAFQTIAQDLSNLRISK